MSYRTWTEYGYGVTTPYNGVTAERFIAFCNNHECLKSFLRESDIRDLKSGDAEVVHIAVEYEDVDGVSCGLASMLKDVIKAEKGIRLVAVDDYDGLCYLLFTPAYPWSEIYEEEKKIKTKKDVEDVMFPYLAELYGEGNEPALDYLECQNGG